VCIENSRQRLNFTAASLMARKFKCARSRYLKREGYMELGEREKKSLIKKRAARERERER
jgi:hypothetical protein